MKALTLRLEDDEYERLRVEAFEKRTTITALIRESLAARYGVPPTPEVSTGIEPVQFPPVSYPPTEES